MRKLLDLLNLVLAVPTTLRVMQKFLFCSEELRHRWDLALLFILKNLLP